MKKIQGLFLLLLCSLLLTFQSIAQRVDSIKFFTDERPLDVKLSADFKKLFAEKTSEALIPATISIRFPDSSVITEEIRINARGITRKEICKIPPIFLNFKNPTSPRLISLKKLKLVSACGTSNDEAQLLLKEALAYKLYNQVTDMSLRIRLIHITYEDTKGKMRTYTQPGFVIEDIDAMAKRNKCVEVEKQMFETEKTNREHMTLVALFEYMIGNLDWSVPVYHNIKLIRPKKDSLAAPYTIAYDFDYSGLVNAPYAIPPEMFTEITSVTQRLYRGFPRTMEELQKCLAIFRSKKDAMNNLITNFEGFSKFTKKETTDFLGEFFSMIEKESQVKKEFIDNARTK